MKTRQDHLNEIAAAKGALVAAEGALHIFDAQPENNIFETMERAESEIEDALLDLAHNDCEGAYNCGLEEYRRKFIVDGKTYEGVLKCEYNRHDKTYYYVDGHEFEVIETA